MTPKESVIVNRQSKYPNFCTFLTSLYVSGQQTSILFNNVPVEVDANVIYEVFSVNVTPKSVSVLIFSRELIDHPVYIIGEVHGTVHVHSIVN